MKTLKWMFIVLIGVSIVVSSYLYYDSTRYEEIKVIPEHYFSLDGILEYQYPTFEIISINKSKKINRLIYDDLMRFVNYFNELELRKLEFNYTLTLKNEQFLSIEYKGMTNYIEGYKRYYEPVYFVSNIDVKNEEILSFDDLINRESMFFDWFKGDQFIAITQYSQEDRETFFETNSEKIATCHNDEFINFGRCFYLNYDSIGISFPYDFRYGGVFKFQIRYDLLTDEMKTDHPFWDDIKRVD